MLILLRYLTMLSVLAAAAQGYTLDASSPLAVRLTDVATDISSITILLQDKPTKITVEGFTWTSSSSDADANPTNSLLNYTTFLDDKEVASGSIQLSNDPLKLPPSIDAGEFSVTATGIQTLRVVLMDSNLQAFEVQMETRAYQAWMAGIPFVVSLILFLCLKADLVQALFVSIFIGSCIVHGSLVQGFRAIFDTYVLDAASRSEHVSLVFFIVGIFTCMEMVNKSGGANEILRAVSPYTSRARIAQIVLLSMGLLTYFDPYTSILMIGKVFGPVLKGFPISAEKLSFLVDTTALPVSSVIPGSTYIMTAASALQKGLSLAEKQQEGADIDAQSFLVSSIKYQFYPILILLMTILQAVLSREAGGMLKRENEKRSNYGDEEQELETALSAIRRSSKKVERSWNWWVPVGTLNVILWVAFFQMDSTNDMSFVSSLMTSTAAAVVLIQVFYLYQPQAKPDLQRLLFWQKKETRLAFLTDTFPSGSSSYAVTTKSEGHEEQHIDADFGDIIESPKMSRQTHEMPVDSPDRREKCLECMEKMKDSCVLSPTETLRCLSRGIASSVPAIVSLLLSWSASEVYSALGIDRISAGWILNERIAVEAVPTVAFFSTFLLSLVLGSSWSAVSVMMPAVTMSLSESDLFTLIVGSILSGAVAGDHIGPFSETTILSGTTTPCGVRQHFISQAPYALSVLLLSVLVGTVPISFSAYPEFVGFFIGFIAICIAIVFVCRRVQNPKFVPGRASEAITHELHAFGKGPGEPSHSKYVPEGMIMAVNTDDLIDRDEDQTVGADEAGSSIDHEHTLEKKLIPIIRTHTLQSFKNKLQEVNSGSGDPILGLVADGLLPSDITNELKRPQEPPARRSLAKIPRDPSIMSKKTHFESKKKLIEATIKSSEKDSNIFSDSLRMFLRTAETKLDQIMSEGSIDLKPSESNDSDDDSLDHLMMDIAAKGWKPAAGIAGQEDDGDTDTGEGYATTGGYTTGGDYTTDGGHSVLEESDDSASASTTSSSGGDGQSTAFTTDGENHSASTSNGPSVSESEGTQGAEEQMRSTLMNPLAFHKSHQVFAWMNGSEESQEDTETDTAFGSRDPSKASF